MQDATRTVVLASGSGSNFQALIDDNNTASGLHIVGLVCDQPGAKALQRAADAGIASNVVQHDKNHERSVFDQHLADAVTAFDPGLIVLAGFMKIIAGELIERFQGKMLNIHPALLPNYKGLHTHRRCLASGDPLHGSTVHFVTEGLDEGPSLLQASLVVGREDTETSLSARVQALEHKIYPMAARWVADGRARMRGGQVWLDGLAMSEPIVMTEDELQA